MAQVVKLKRSAVAGKVPDTSNLELGELAVNTADGRIFFEKSGSSGITVEHIVTTNSQTTGSLELVGNLTITGSLLTTGSAILTGSLSADLVSSPIISFDNTVDINTTIESGSYAVSIGDLTLNSGVSIDVVGTWDIIDSDFFTQASNKYTETSDKQVYGLLFDFDGAIALSVLTSQNLWKNNSTAERWYNNAYQWDPNEVDSSGSGRVKVQVSLTYDKDGGNAYVRLVDVKDGVKTYLGSDWHQLTTSDPSSTILTKFEFEGIDGAGTPFTPGGSERYLALESFTNGGIYLGLYKADVKLTVY